MKRINEDETEYVFSTDEKTDAFADAMILNLDEKKRSKRGRLVVMSVVIGLVFFALIAFFTSKSVFSVKEINIEGSTKYSDEEILQALGFSKGDVIFSVSQGKTAGLMTLRCPYICSVKIEKNYPDTVNVILEDEVPKYRFMLGDKHIVASESGKVLYIGEELPDEHLGLVSFSLPAVGSAIFGYPLTFSSSADEKALSVLLDALDESPVKDLISRIDMTSRFDIRLFCDDRFEILIGDKSDIQMKLRFAYGIIESLKNGERGQINVKDPEKGYLTLG